MGQLRLAPAKTWTKNEVDEEQIINILRRAIGDRHVAIKIINTMRWQLTVKIASQFQYGRIFLAGDSAHTMTPYGGKGANTGIQDAHNLAWKLAAVIKGYGSADLLATYHTERHPVGEFYALRSGEMAADNGLVKEKLVMSKMKSFIGLPDYRYASAAITGGKSLVASENDMLDVLGLPGSRMPHVWLDALQTQSTLDLINGHFLFIGVENDAALKESIGAIAEATGIPVRMHTFTGSDIAFREWEAATGMKAGDLMIVRPDGFIAYRGSLLAEHPETVMKRMLIYKQ